VNRYVVIRLLQVIPTVLLSTLFVFLTLSFMRGDAIDVYFGVSEDRSPEAEERLRRELGLDKPLPMQYLLWLGRAIQGDLGESWRFREPVLGLISQRVQLSFELAGIAIVISVVCSILLGVYLAVNQDSIADQAIRFVSLVFISAPVYWVALALIVFLSQSLHWMPPIRYVSLMEDPLKHLEIIALPAALWGLLSVPSFSRYVRNALLDILSADFIRTARAKGVPERRVLYRHALRNAAGPLATLVGLSIAGAAGGALLLEVVFTLPGMGRLWLAAIFQRDYPMVLGIGVFISTIFVLVNLLTDLSYAWLDPRIRYQ
jgi:peptide/nickel transport system permease protein